MNEFEHVRGDKAGASGVGPMWMGSLVNNFEEFQAVVT